jgi:hypothetical protein
MLRTRGSDNDDVGPKLELSSPKAYFLQGRVAFVCGVERGPCNGPSFVFGATYI